MRVLREIYDFITGGSIVAPAGLALAVLATLLVHAWRAEVFTVLILATFVTSTFERPN